MIASEASFNLVTSTTGVETNDTVDCTVRSVRDIQLHLRDCDYIKLCCCSIANIS